MSLMVTAGQVKALGARVCVRVRRRSVLVRSGSRALGRSGARAASTRLVRHAGHISHASPGIGSPSAHPSMPMAPTACLTSPFRARKRAVGANGTLAARVRWGRPGRPRDGPTPIYGSVVRYGATVSAKLYPLDASQLISQVITPLIPGQVVGGTKLPQFCLAARQSSASSTTEGETYPLP